MLNLENEIKIKITEIEDEIEENLKNIKIKKQRNNTSDDNNEYTSTAETINTQPNLHKNTKKGFIIKKKINLANSISNSISISNTTVDKEKIDPEHNDAKIIFPQTMTRNALSLENEISDLTQEIKDKYEDYFINKKSELLKIASTKVRNCKKEILKRKNNLSDGGVSNSLNSNSSYSDKNQINSNPHTMFSIFDNMCTAPRKKGKISVKNENSNNKLQSIPLNNNSYLNTFEPSGQKIVDKKKDTCLIF